MKKMIWAFLLAFLLGIPALAEDWEDEWLFVDLSGESLVSYNVVKWNFPVDIADMDPELIVLVNKSMFLNKKYEPAGLVKMKSLKLDKQGNNTNGGVRQVDGTWQLRQECATALVALCDAARAEGQALSVLKLNRVLPIADEAVAIAKQYRCVLVLEETRGGVGELLAADLMKEGYQGRYGVRAIRETLGACTTEQGLHRVGLDAEGVADFVNRYREAL